jgi:hypothetical protein
MPNEKTRPVHEIRLGRVKGAIWGHETQKGKVFTVSIVCLYKEGTAWRESTSFSRDDLPLVAKIADRAHSWIFAENQDRNSPQDKGLSDSPREEF